MSLIHRTIKNDDVTGSEEDDISMSESYPNLRSRKLIIVIKDWIDRGFKILSYDFWFKGLKMEFEVRFSWPESLSVKFHHSDTHFYATKGCLSRNLAND